MYYDVVLCFTKINYKDIQSWIKKLNSLKLKYKILVPVTKSKSRSYNSLDSNKVLVLEIPLKSMVKFNLFKEKTLLKYAFDNFIGLYYFTLGSKDKSNDFDIAYLLSRKKKLDFVNFKSKRSIFEIISKLSPNKEEYSFCSSYNCFSRRYLRLILYDELNKERILNRDISWESILLFKEDLNFKYKCSLKSKSILISGVSKGNLLKKINILISLINKNIKDISAYILILTTGILNIKVMVFLLFLFLIFKIYHKELVNIHGIENTDRRNLECLK